MQALVPRAPLDACVEVIWLMAPGGHGEAAVLALPTGTVELVVEFDPGPATARAQLCGVHTRPFRIDAGTPALTLGVHFRPGGAAALLPFAPHETLEQRLEAHELFAAELEQLSAALAAGDDAARLLGLMERLLVERLRGPRCAVVRWAVTALASAAPPTVSTLVDRSGYSHRRFNELFRREVGMTPKRYSRLARLQHTLGRLGAEPAPDWADVAAACGFHDQSHLIHEFRRHFDLTPATYLARRVGHPNHPLAD